MTDMTTSRQTALRSAQIVHGFMFFMTIIYAVTAELLGPRTAGSPPDRIFYFAFMILAVMEVVIALFFRLRFINASAERLRLHSDDTDALFRWRNGSIIVSVLASTVAMYGFILRFLGASTAQGIPFYALAVVLLVLWWPRLDA